MIPAGIEHERALEVIHAHPRARKELGAVQRGLSAAAGATLVIRGVARRDLPGLLAIAAGGALILRGARGGGQAVRERAGGAAPEAAPEPILLSRCITIGERPERILDVVRRPELWLAGRHGQDLRVEGGRWYVTVRALGRRAYELAVDVEPPSDGSIAWRSGPEAPLRHEGCLRLQPAPDDRGTEARATVRLEPEGVLGRALGSALHGVAERVLGQALHRLRQAVEVGEPARSEPQPHGRRRLLTSVAKAGSEES